MRKDQREARVLRPVHDHRNIADRGSFHAHSV
jgi:hypothetical protein